MTYHRYSYRRRLELLDHAPGHAVCPNATFEDDLRPKALSPFPQGTKMLFIRSSMSPNHAGQLCVMHLFASPYLISALNSIWHVEHLLSISCAPNFQVRLSDSRYLYYPSSISHAFLLRVPNRPLLLNLRPSPIVVVYITARPPDQARIYLNVT